MTTVSPPLATDQAQSTGTELQQLLFGGQDDLHAPWRLLFSDEAFAYQDLTVEERVERSYARLRILNAAVPDPCMLACNPTALSALHEWAWVDAGLVTIASIHYNLFLGSILDHDEAQQRNLTPYIRMDRIGTFLCTELAHGNDAPNLETTAAFDPATGEFVLTTPGAGARKSMPNTSGVGGAKDALVAARLIVDDTDHGVFLFLTSLTDAQGNHLPGVEAHPLPQAATAPMDHCTTSFHGVRLPYTAMLQGPHGRLSRSGEFTSELGSARKRFLRSIGRMTLGKMCMSSAGVGSMRHALRVAVRYSHQRVTSGLASRQRVPLWAHRTHHAPLLDGLAAAYAATLLHRAVVRRWSRTQESDREDAERLAAIAKGWITWQAREVLSQCRERCGAQGLLLVNGIAGELAAVEGTITAEGDNTVIWIKAAGELLLGGFTPRPPHDVPPEHRSLHDPEQLTGLLADLERIYHEQARTRLRSGGRRTPLDRWNGSSQHAMALVDAHAHRLAAEAMTATAEQATEPQARRLLRELHRLFALRYVTAHSGVLLAHERLTPRQVREELADTLAETVSTLVPHAEALTEAFTVPEALLKRHPMLWVDTPQVALPASRDGSQA